MLRRKDTDIPATDVEMDGAEGVKIRVIISKEDGAPNCVMRRFTIEPGGHTPYHTHNWEHEIYVLSGEGEARQGDRSVSHSRLPGAPDCSDKERSIDEDSQEEGGSSPPSSALSASCLLEYFYVRQAPWR